MRTFFKKFIYSVGLSRYFEKMLRNPAGERNKDPILDVIKQYISPDTKATFLEISSGTGLHVSYIAPNFPDITFQPSEYEVGMFTSINAYRAKSSNVLEPTFIDISTDLNEWTAKMDGKLIKDLRNTFDYMLNINMIHISPFTCTMGLFKNASALLKPNGILFTYGPYSENYVLQPESNISFNRSLQQQNPEWGIRDICDLKEVAEQNSIQLEKIFNLPANNKLLVWRKLV